MADVSGRTWRFTSADAGATFWWPQTSGWRPQQIYWFNPNNVGDLCQIKDGAGKIVIDARCEVANQSQVWNLYTWYYGFQIPTLTSGTLYVQLK